MTPTQRDRLISGLINLGYVRASAPAGRPRRGDNRLYFQKGAYVISVGNGTSLRRADGSTVSPAGKAAILRMA